MYCTARLALRAGQWVWSTVSELAAALGVCHLPQVRTRRPDGVEMLLACGEEYAEHDLGAGGRPRGLEGGVAALTCVEPDLPQPGAVRMDHEHLSVRATEQDPLPVRGPASRILGEVPCRDPSQATPGRSWTWLVPSGFAVKIWKSPRLASNRPSTRASRSASRLPDNGTYQSRCWQQTGRCARGELLGVVPP